MTTKQLQQEIETNYVSGLRDASKFTGLDINFIMSISKTHNLNPITIGKTNLYSKKELLEVKQLLDNK